MEVYGEEFERSRNRTLCAHMLCVSSPSLPPSLSLSLSLFFCSFSFAVNVSNSHPAVASSGLTQFACTTLDKVCIWVFRACSKDYSVA